MFDDIIKATAENHGLHPDSLRGRRRDAATARARQEAMYNILMQTDCTLEECGKALGGRTPATITYSFQKIALLKRKPNG